MIRRPPKNAPRAG